MAIIGGQTGYRIMKFIAPRKKTTYSYEILKNDANTKLGKIFGENFYRSIEGKTVIDFGCGVGQQTIEMAQKGATKVIGLDIRDELLELGRQKALQYDLSDRCVFTKRTNEIADLIVTKDAFEHVDNLLHILNNMATLIKQDGYILASFGPTWLHPYGGHLFSVFPWSHIIFSEYSLIKWRSDFKSDGASRFCEVEGGLNKITISKFEDIVNQSYFMFEWIDTIPVKKVILFKKKMLREFFSSLVICKLKLK